MDVDNRMRVDAEQQTSSRNLDHNHPFASAMGKLVDVMTAWQPRRLPYRKYAVLRGVSWRAYLSSFVPSRGLGDRVSISLRCDV